MHTGTAVSVDVPRWMKPSNVEVVGSPHRINMAPSLKPSPQLEGDQRFGTMFSPIKSHSSPQRTTFRPDNALPGDPRQSLNMQRREDVRRTDSYSYENVYRRTFDEVRACVRFYDGTARSFTKHTPYSSM